MIRQAARSRGSIASRSAARCPFRRKTSQHSQSHAKQPSPELLLDPMEPERGFVSVYVLLAGHEGNQKHGPQQQRVLLDWGEGARDTKRKVVDVLVSLVFPTPP